MPDRSAALNAEVAIPTATTVATAAIIWLPISLSGLMRAVPMPGRPASYKRSRFPLAQRFASKSLLLAAYSDAPGLKGANTPIDRRAPSIPAFDDISKTVE
jgi:hypothetical protein